MIRRFLGHERYSGQVAGQTIAHLHGAMRLYVNYFQPSFKLMEKTRNGSAGDQALQSAGHALRTGNPA